MKAVLVRVGIDTTSGGWNSPVDPQTKEFVFVPIPEVRKRLRPSLARRYDEIVPALLSFGFSLPEHLRDRVMHLDPDFEHLTYGDKNVRGRQLLKLEPGDLVVFFASLKAADTGPRHLVYALIGIYVVDGIESASSVPQRQWNENAHTIRYPEDDDLIIRGLPSKSGRFERCVPIGEYRDKAYRVRRDLLDEWGGLTVRDGYVQRSARLPWFKSPRRFLSWLDRQDVRLCRRAS